MGGAYKFTADGRKVAVVGALNAKETIVQEIFVNDGTEFPAGEHFVVKTLLDAPAETYKAKEERRIIESIQTLESEREKLKAEIAGFKFKAQAAAAKIKWTECVTEPELEAVMGNLKSMLSGEYTHVVMAGHSTEIKEWGHELFTTCDDYGRGRFESLKMISLYGEWNGRLKLDWKVNTYRDGSGSSYSFIPCKSLTEAVEKAKEVVYAKEHLSDSDAELCIEYGIPLDAAKNAARLEGKRHHVKSQIEENKKRLAKLEADLAAIQ